MAGNLKTPVHKEQIMDEKDFLTLADGKLEMSKSMTGSQVGAKLASLGLVSSQTSALYSPKVNTERITLEDMVAETSTAAGDVTNRKFGRVETMLVSHMIALDAMFNNLAQRAYKAEYLDSVATYTKLALRCQAQARCAAEALAIIKNPQPYIKQTNIAQGHQQVNNTYASTYVCNDQADQRAEENKSAQSKLLGDNNERMDTRTQNQAGRIDQVMETVGTQHRRKDSRRQSKGG